MLISLKKHGDKMYNLYFLKTKWRIEVGSGKGGIFEGSLKDVTAYAEIYFGINMKEMDIGLDDMIKKGHDAANFGINGGFIYSFNKGNGLPTEKRVDYGLH
jgi:hypothetical protein